MWYCADWFPPLGFQSINPSVASLFLARFSADAFNPDRSPRTDEATVNVSGHPALFAMDISACHKAITVLGCGFSSSLS